MTSMNEMVASSDFVTARQERPDLKKLVIATSVGNALEWYDITIYGYFALYLSHAFFPSDDAKTSLLLALGTFGISFLIRPVGGIVLGAYADRVGRKASLMVSIVLMTIGTLAIALMPTYETIGILAPIGVLLARLLQGFSAGGEFGSSTAFLVEHAPHRRGFIASWQFASQGLSTLLASAFGFGLAHALTTDDLNSWGWRIPFLFGVLVGPVGIYIRKHLEDAAPAPAAAARRSPLGETLAQHKSAVLLGIGALAISTAVNYLIIYMPTYVVKTLKLPAETGFAATLAAGIALTFLTPFAGLISDRIGRVRHMTIVGAILLATLYPAFAVLTNSPSSATIIVVVLWLAALKAFYYGPLAALMSELFPAACRATGLGLSYNIGVTIFGGMGPVIMAWLGDFEVFGELAPSYYLHAVCVFSLICLLMIRKRGTAM